jgi:conjugative transposon TraJ protein
MKAQKVMLLLAAVLLPIIANAQDPGEAVADKIYSLNSVLDKLFDEMLPLCSRMMDIGRAIAGLAALFYIGTRVWKHLANAEPIDFYPLLRPFAIGMAILLFPSVIALMNGVLQPTVEATAAMSKDSHKAIQWSLDQKEKAIRESAPVGSLGGTGSDDMQKYEQPGGTDDGGGLFSAFSIFSFESAVKRMIRDFFSILYSAAALCINTVRTFYLIVLVILGPLVFGLSVFDGFQNTLSSWFSRYVNVFMWLPVANIFGAISSKILENMMLLDQDFFSSVAYIVFMVICIIGYTTVPTVAGYIVQAGELDAFRSKVTGAGEKAGAAVKTAGAAVLKGL